MSITIEEVIRWREGDGLLYWTEEELADAFISQHKELEILRAQLAEKDAILAKCAEALCEAYNELYAYYYDHPVKVRLRNMMEELEQKLSR